jgi:thioesterase domain-containing protein
MSISDDRVASLSPHRRSLLRQLQATRAQAASPSLDHPAIPMRRGAGPARVILLHPAGGELFCYTPLVRLLPQGIEVTGFAADPADSDLPIHHRLTEVARRTLAALARTGEPGRCVLAGWSYGGTLAFEMARLHAQESGQQLPVVLMDCLYYGDVPLEDEATVRRRFVYDVARLAGRPSDAVEDALAAIDPGAASLRAMLDAAEVDISLTDREVTGRYRIFRACSLSLQCYRPPAPYPGPVTVAAALGADYVTARWRAVSTGPFASVRLPGDHYTLFTGPALPIVAGTIAAEVRALSDELGPAARAACLPSGAPGRDG